MGDVVVVEDRRCVLDAPDGRTGGAARLRVVALLLWKELLEEEGEGEEGD